ncbi:MAG: hypothetical protein PHH83_03835 [Patescibacteria group bacterium]|nr:hypothetical protein [Patescibacteria group bacterium]
MQVNKKQIIILIIFILIVLIIFGFLFFFNKKQTEVQKIQETNQSQPTETTKEEFNSIKFESEAKIEDTSQIAELSRNFIERYGSWSNQTENFYELISPMITDRMYNQANNFISKNPNFIDKSTYYGITTKLINLRVLELSNNSAVLSLQLQQTESKNSKEDTFYKKAELSLIFQDNKWLVDSVTWQ